MTAATIRGFGIWISFGRRNLNCIRPVDHRSYKLHAYSRHMERLVQWAWDHYGSNFSWAFWAISCVVPFPIYLYLASGVVAFEHSDRYLAAVGATCVTMLFLAFGLVLPGVGPLRTVERWAAGENIDAATALEATYSWGRGAIVRGLVVCGVCGAVLAVVAGELAGASGSRLVQYALLGVAVGAGSHLIGVHSVAEIAMRPVRVTLVEGTAIGVSLPRSRPRFAAWSNLAILAVAFAFSIATAMVTATFEQLGR
ncbi:MAG: hypothetical protein E6R00_00915, partial [Gammaproteobacteria bacterium]